jgi:O-antigen/teichoic acid export membrane protein
MTALEFVLLPWASNRLIDQGFAPFKKDILKVSWLLTVLTGVYVLILSFSAEPLMRILYGAKYQASVWLVPWLALASLISTPGNGCLLGLRIAQASRPIFVSTCIRAAVTILLGSVFVRMLGLQGIVLGMLISSASQVPAIFWYWRKTASQRTHEVLL